MMISQPDRFELTAAHLALLREAYVSWEECEYGAPSIDCKRPYGNSSVGLDIAEILGWTVDDEDGLTAEQQREARAIHEETREALQILLHVADVPAGSYEKPRYGGRWTRVEP